MGDPEEVEAELAAAHPAGEDDDDSDETSLDELLAQRAARRSPEEPEEDVEDIMTLSSEKDAPREPLPTRVVPIRDREEFVCNRCHLVKKRVQLADADKGYCRDCV